MVSRALNPVASWSKLVGHPAHVGWSRTHVMRCLARGTISSSLHQRFDLFRVSRSGRAHRWLCSAGFPRLTVIRQACSCALKSACSDRSRVVPRVGRQP
jgi:hypothetical protein